MTTGPFLRWRRVHRAASALVALVSLIHIGVTLLLYDSWGPDALWFAGTGVGLLAMAIMNIAHVGLEPCSLPTAPVVRWLNWAFAALGVAGVVAVRELQAVVIAAGLLVQAVASVATLPGSNRGASVASSALE